MSEIGDYNIEYTVTITSSEPGTTIKYTEDGTDPSRTDGNVNSGTHAASCFRQAADIDLSSYNPWTPVDDATHVFTGIYDGDNFNISNLTIDTAADYLGFFGQVPTDSTIQNINLANAVISASANSKLLELGKNQATRFSSS